jgi:hypothetical protein
MHHQALIRSSSSYKEPTPRKLLPILPPELHDVVIDHLHSHKSSLAACSLVCKAWVPSSRLHLFEYVFVRPHEINSFLALLTSPLCTMATSVRQISLSKTDNVLLAVRRLAVALTKVQHLALSNSPFDPDYFGAQAFKGLSRLTLMSMRFSSISQLFDALCSLPRLEGLTISNAEVSYRPTIPSLFSPEIPRSPPILRKLWLTTSQTVQILEWLLQYPQSYRAISDITVGVEKPDEVPIVSKFLQALGSALEELHIFQHTSGMSLSHYARHQVPLAKSSTSVLFTGPEAINLLHNTNLRVFSLYLRSSHYLVNIIPILAQINASSIQKITIDYGSRVDRDVARWSAFQQVLVQLNLRSLTLYAAKEDRPWIIEQLQELAKRRVLTFAF